MRFPEIIRYCIIAAASAMALQSCTSVTDDPGPCQGKNTFTLSFKMLTEDPLQATRSDSDPNHSEVSSEYRALEDGISRNDIGLFIFAKAQGVSEEKLILKLTDIGSSSNPQMMITGSPGAYTITMAFDKNRFSESLGGYEVTPEGDRQIQFRVLILANCNPAANGLSWDNINADTFSGVIDQAKDLKFSMTGLYNNSEGDSDVTGLYKGNIPMFGTNIFTVREIDLWSSKAEERIYLGEVDMLRALAKVRVVDNIQNKDENGYPKITQVEFIGSQNESYCLPNNASGYSNGNQVHDPNVCNTDVSFTGDFTQYTYKLGTIPEGWDMTLSTERKGDTRIGYVPEQEIAYLNNNVERGFPIFRISIDVIELENGTPVTVTKTYDVPMEAENGQNQGQDAYILRNHIYTLSVNRVGLSTPADITVKVDNWTTQDVNLVYSDQVTVAQRIDWDEDTYENINPDTGEVYVKPFTADNKPVVLSCKFRISTPIGMGWTAYLLQKDGEDNNAFVFTDETGTESWQTVSGIINNLASTLYLKATNPAPTELNSALLQIAVTLGNQTTIEVPLTPVIRNYKNYTIVQDKLTN